MTHMACEVDHPYESIEAAYAESAGSRIDLIAGTAARLRSITLLLLALGCRWRSQPALGRLRQ
jgi:hypothetical protein